MNKHFIILYYIIFIYNFQNEKIYIKYIFFYDKYNIYLLLF